MDVQGRRKYTYLRALPAFHRPHVGFRNRKRSKMNDLEQTDIRFEFSSSRSTSTRVFRPNGRNQLMFSSVSQFFVMWHFFVLIFFFAFCSHSPNILLPNDSSHQKDSDAQKIKSIGWIFGTFVFKKLLDACWGPQGPNKVALKGPKGGGEGLNGPVRKRKKSGS